MTRAVTDHASAVAVVLEAIEFIAPDIDASALPTDVDIRVEAELDSMDFMAVLTTIKERTGIEVPESDIASVSTVDGCAAHLVEHAAGSATTAPRRADRP